MCQENHRPEQQVEHDALHPKQMGINDMLRISSALVKAMLDAWSFMLVAKSMA